MDPKGFFIVSSDFRGLDYLNGGSTRERSDCNTAFINKTTEGKQ